MSEKLTSKYSTLIGENFKNWVNDLRRDKKNVGEILADIWNQYAEDVMPESQLLFDLTKKEDFAAFFIDCGYIEVARKKGLPSKETRWAIVSSDMNKTSSDEIYRFFNEDDLMNLCFTFITDIAECVIAWPSLYSREFYEAIIWPILKEEQFLHISL